jgi:hypothetical protein
MLNLAIVADDEPGTIVASVLDRAAIDRRRINRLAVKFWPTIRNLITDMHGRPLGDVASLNPAYDPRGWPTASGGLVRN